jgi:bacterioferritin (cytochrome b1)
MQPSLADRLIGADGVPELQQQDQAEAGRQKKNISKRFLRLVM